MKNYEVIAINDGSTDGSLKILQSFASTHDNLTIINQENQGQGKARNHAIGLARGEYIQFLDADDWVEPNTLELTVKCADNNRADVVRYGWRYSDLDEKQLAAYRLANGDPFNERVLLEGAECDELLRIKHYFSMNNLYRRDFLNKHQIRYGEGRLYEDNVFITLVANRANRIAILQETLYTYRRNPTSSTRTGHEDERHGVSFIRAVRESISVLRPRTEYTTYYLAKYFQTKFLRYYDRRIPKSYKLNFLKQYVDSMSGLQIKIPSDAPPERILRLCAKRKIFQKKRYREFQTYVYHKTKVLPARDKIRSNFRKVRPSSSKDAL
jgi:glycosyltransferase involved in cell wall biosynthesis